MAAFKVFQILNFIRSFSDSILNTYDPNVKKALIRLPLGLRQLQEDKLNQCFQYTINTLVIYY